MCRLAAYLGQDLLLHKLLNEPPNSLIKQSWDAEELREATLNADGFGFGWYLDERQPAIYTSTLPIWSDANLGGLARTLRKHLWLAYVRSATPGQPLSQANTQPFQAGQFLFMHNGRIDGFNEGPRAQFHSYLDADIAAGIQGNTDSEYLFALFRQHYRQTPITEMALLNSSKALEAILDGTPALVNMMISDGHSIFSCRHALGGDLCPSLYYTRSHPAYPEALVIASERFSATEHWQEVAAHTLLIAKPDQSIDTIAL